MNDVSTVLYDAPGPVTRRRQRLLSALAGLLILAVLAWGLYAMYRNDIFNDRWLVLVDPPRGQTVENVWWDSLLWGGLIQGTLKAAALAMPLAGLLALVLVILRTTPRRAVRTPTTGLIELFRGLPVLVLMMFGYFVFDFSPFTSVVFGLVIYNGAIVAEILRAGLSSLAKGQGEAGSAIGLSWFQNFFIIMLPQAVRVMLPSLIAQLVVLLKDTSIGFIIAYHELLRASQINYNFFGNESRLPFFVAALGIYLTLNFTLTRLAIVVERRLRQRGQRVGKPGRQAAARNPLSTGSNV
ncbi:amino acid ABC transporter membrane protein 2, PAAT family [Georgenia satyanarayanai]|uniref:Amino acid ABC transporter membrane protein 2, PAAT family n=1 Tax=Georgenia satyanarayanai TaxID=860221 RepID=A0A2Y9AHK8_9MICO|nr:amino acid ABC transporter permease [Georgenia satyanarayanai]PYF99862.1 amino acid ABC transporter membrane protein 2 (PAAT family) [Georgenia satyanarayanai]SSA41847.1 amino acid ABC transporter membrane protein 2, PAAT family [Georgenia satyanarayanai]